MECWCQPDAALSSGFPSDENIISWVCTYCQHLFQTFLIFFESLSSGSFFVPFCGAKQLPRCAAWRSGRVRSNHDDAAAGAVLTERTSYAEQIALKRIARRCVPSVDMM